MVQNNTLESNPVQYRPFSAEKLAVWRVELLLPGGMTHVRRPLLASIDFSRIQLVHIPFVGVSDQTCFNLTIPGGRISCLDRESKLRLTHKSLAAAFQLSPLDARNQPRAPADSSISAPIPSLTQGSDSQTVSQMKRCRGPHCVADLSV